VELSAAKEKKASSREHCEWENGANQVLPVVGARRRLDIPESRIQV